MSTGLRIAFGPGVCGDLGEASRREWLVADGLGGYAHGTVAGLRTRRYHGLLMTATAPAGGARMLALAALDAVVVIGQRRVRLATHEWAATAVGSPGAAPTPTCTPGTVDPRGHELISTFDLDDGVPRWRYDLGDVRLEVEVAMAHGESTVAVVHRLLSGRARLEVSPLCTWRDQHGERFGGLGTADPHVDVDGEGIAVESAYRVSGPGYTPGGAWYRGVFLREEAARGFDGVEDLWAAGSFAADLEPGQALCVSASTRLGGGPLPPATAVVAAARRRAAGVEARAGADDDAGRILVRAADQFVVTTPSGPAVVAGYPWFGEWSRDTFTAYEGLFLCTGRADEGREVLTRAAATLSEGMLANTADAGLREYNTIDATLWFLHALGRHVEVTGDLDLAAELAGAVAEVLRAHRAGTRFGIGVDEATGLLRGGAPGWALTWMDARVDGRAVTARAGYPVEVQALWINALAVAGRLLPDCRGQEWERLRLRALTSFGRLFTPGDDGLPDVVDHAGVAHRECRPNQLLAVSLPHGPVTDPDAAARVVDVCHRQLWTCLGPRSLAPGQLGYLGRHRGDPAERDAAYHQGTVWPWLSGPFVGAALRAGADPTPLLDPLLAHLAEFGLGSVSETADGDPPHAATGCPFQAWSVAELVRARAAVAQPSVSSAL